MLTVLAVLTEAEKTALLDLAEVAVARGLVVVDAAAVFAFAAGARVAAI